MAGEGGNKKHVENIKARNNGDIKIFSDRYGTKTKLVVIDYVAGTIKDGSGAPAVPGVTPLPTSMEVFQYFNHLFNLTNGHWQNINPALEI